MVEHQPNWDEHILIVFSVLAGLAFTESFSQLSSKGFGIPESILTFIVFYAVLDNWYWLHKDLVIIDVTSSIEVVLYLLSIISYSCDGKGDRFNFNAWVTISPVNHDSLKKLLKATSCILLFDRYLCPIILRE